jgi:hypothetical protein
MRCDYGLERIWTILGHTRNVKKWIYIQITSQQKYI